MKASAGTAVERLAEQLAEIAPAAAASEIEAAGEVEAIEYATRLPAPVAARVIEHLPPISALQMLEALKPLHAGPILEAMDPSRAAALIARLDDELRQKHLATIPDAKAKELDELASYPQDTAGSLMDPRVMAFHPSMEVRDVLRKLRKLPQKKARELFLVDEDGILVGAVPLQELVVAEPQQKLGKLMGRPPVAVLGVASRNEVVDALTQGEMASIVVVDFNNRLLGIIRRDTLIRAVQEDATVNVQTMVGASKEERALSPSLFAVRKRLPWLVINLGTAFLAAAVVGVFESTIARFTALAVLLPVVAGQSGNTGAQALAVTMRGLALRELRTSHALQVCFKELRAAFVNGLAVAIITATMVYIWNESVGLTLVIGISMVISMMAAGLSGALIPLVLTAIRQDPAQSSSIILTTVTDVVGFFSFLGIATMLASMI